MRYSSAVREIYAAFSKGNVPALLSHISESVDWEYGADNNAIPWLQHGQGHPAVISFLQTLNDQVQFNKFNPKMLFENSNTVLALVDLDINVKTTGKHISEEDEVHIWHFNEAGKVIRFRHRADTLQHFKATQQ